jgi:pyruvate/2-oxoglutarate dehydrogenase complex dihydrolipoamide dehydrogenase (E3) component
VSPLPHDPHDRALLDAVHPGSWRNPRPARIYDLVVLGGGTGGLVSAAIASALGARVALVERALLGGDCLNTGCVPSKALLAAARSWHAARTGAARFGAPPAAGEGDFAAAMQHLRRVRAEIAPHDGAPRFRDLGVDVFLGQGTFVGARALRVEGVTLRFRRAIVATGSRPAVPSLPGLEESGYLTSESVFDLETLPDSLLVLGGGAIGCELGQAFARLGSRVTLVEAASRLLPRDDADAAAAVGEALRRDGVEVLTGAEAVGVRRSGEGREVDLVVGGEPRVLAADRLLVAAGRRPRVEGCGLEAAGVRAGAGGVETDAKLRTSNRRIYAVGDVTGGPPFTHAADAQARVAVRNALFRGRARADDLVIPWCTYTSPEVAQVGLTGEAAAAEGTEVDSLTIPLSAADRPRLEGEAEGFLRVHLKPGSDRILGATLVGEAAGEIIGLLAHAMRSGTGLEALGDTVLPYPTRAEIVRRAADQRRRRRLTPGARLLLRALLWTVRLRGG